MVEINIAYEGGLHTQAVHGPSGQSLSTDAPKDNQGRGESFSPSDLLATSLGTCMLTMMGMEAKKLNIPLEGTNVRVEKHMVNDPKRKIGKLVLDFHLPKGLNPEQKNALEESIKGCPVCRSIDPKINLRISFHYSSE